MYANYKGFSEKRYRLTDVTNGEANAVSVTVTAMLYEVTLADGRKGYIPLITEPDKGNRSEVTMGLKLDSWLD